jgi:glutathione S-transferase
MITIHNFQHGARGVRIAWLCEEMGLAYEPVVHAFPTSADYRAKYPLGSVPFIEDPDHGVGMGESVAILLHLATTYGPTSLAPQEPTARARMLEIAVMSEASFGGWLNMLLTDRYAAPPEQKGGWLTGMGEAQVKRMLDHLATRKGDSPYLAGREFTLADIAVATSLAMWEHALSRAVPESLAPWLRTVRSRPATHRPARHLRETAMLAAAEFAMIEDAKLDRGHSASRLIYARPSVVYRAFMEHLVCWLPPDGAVGQLDVFEPREGGRFRMRLTFAASQGKTSATTDVVEAVFRRLRPDQKIVFDVTFATDRPEFAGAMTMTWTLVEQDNGTEVTVLAERVPAGVGRTDHERGMRSSLANLAEFVERRQDGRLADDNSSMPSPRAPEKG